MFFFLEFCHKLDNGKFPIVLVPTNRDNGKFPAIVLP